ncbi:hypothetical protein H6504_00750 [Candidatus Woesearchaeota archaeon]|nr:hypothetical protein [Candidatus Woesearchaeota archaeon]
MLVDNTDDFGQLFSYSIMSSLIDFSTTTGAEEQKHFEEVKAVYNGLERTIDACKTEANPYTAIFSHEQNIRQYMDAEATKKDSSLLGVISERLRSGNKSYPDRMRRKGLCLYDLIQNDREHKSTKTALTRNYKLIKRCFTE